MTADGYYKWLIDDLLIVDDYWYWLSLLWFFFAN